jgi:hypothetical protein
LSHSVSPLFCVLDIFAIGSHELFDRGGLRTVILLSS